MGPINAIKYWSAEDVINLCIVIGLQTTALFALCIALWMCAHHTIPPTELWIYITGISTGTIGYLSRGAQALAKAMAQNADNPAQIADSNQGTVIVNPPATGAAP